MKRKGSVFAKRRAMCGVLMAFLTACDETPMKGPQTGEALTVTLPGNVSMAFVRIGPGRVIMGSSYGEAGRFENEGPQHEVAITKGFYMGKYEVTQRQWEAVMGTYPWRMRPPAQGPRDYVVEHPDHPAAYISWNHAQSFIRRLNEAAGDSLYRLPTEAEWEYAARAGTLTPWSFGNNEGRMGDYAWYSDNAWVSDQEDEGEKYAHPVGTKQPNPWGLYDMHGNMWEWCQDWYAEDYYRFSPGADPIGPGSGESRIFKGGDFSSSATLCGSARRGGLPPEFTGNGGIGFRVVRQGADREGGRGIRSFSR